MISLTKSIFLTFLLAFAAQASTTASVPTQTSLPALVSQIPSCVAGCLENIHKAIGCNPADLKCLCSDEASLVTKMGICTVKEGCGTEVDSAASDLIRSICDAMSGKPKDDEVVSAFKILGAAIASTNGADDVTYDIFKVVAAGAVAAFVV